MAISFHGIRIALPLNTTATQVFLACEQYIWTAGFYSQGLKEYRIQPPDKTIRTWEEKQCRTIKVKAAVVVNKVAAAARVVAVVNKAAAVVSKVAAAAKAAAVVNKVVAVVNKVVAVVNKGAVVSKAVAAARAVAVANKVVAVVNKGAAASGSCRLHDQSNLFGLT